MKVFYAELTANPAYYSFGYSVYGELEPGDRVPEMYERGFLPAIVAREQSENLMYMARGVRVRVQEFEVRHYHNRVKRKVEEVIPGGVDASVVSKEEHTNLEEVFQFCLSYFAFRFGKEAMSEERLRAIFASPFLTHIVEYRTGGEVLGYSLEAHHDGMVHVWHQAYARAYARTHLGIYLYIELLERSKKAGAAFLYFGVTYGSWMNYKTNFQPLEYFNGKEWVHDVHSEKLKALFALDTTRLIGFVDEWRAQQKPYYAASYPFTSKLAEVRYLSVLARLFPRVIGAYLLLVALLLWLVLLLVFFVR